MTYTAQRRNCLLSELHELDRLIEQTPERKIFDRMSFEKRKLRVEKELSKLPDTSFEPATFSLVFNGNPVRSNQGISAKFGSTAIKEFADMLATVGASQNAPLGKRGPITNREEYQLFITGTVKGSFGFELEEATETKQLFPESSRVSLAVDQIIKILKASLASDEELSEAISDVDSRAVESIQKFLHTVAEHEAVCALKFKSEAFGFSSVDDVRRGESRLMKDNIHENEETFIGKFLGVLPHGRTFEFQSNDSEKVLSGKIGHDIEEPAEINRMLETEITIRVRSRYVGNSPTKHTLIAISPHASEHESK